MDFEHLVKQAQTEVAMYEHRDYQTKFLSDAVRRARNNWHAAAIRVDEAQRFAGLDSKAYSRAIESEAASHQAYLDAKDIAGILEKIDNED